MRFVKQFLAIFVVAAVAGLGVSAVQGNAPLSLILGLAATVLAAWVYMKVVGRTEHREVVELAWKGAAAPIGRGVLIGVGWFAMVILNIAFLGDYKVNGFGSATGPIGLIGFTAAAAITEELLFRGVLFRIIEERLGTWLTLVVTALLFGIWHGANPDATVWTVLAIAIEAGGVLAAAYAATRTLWVPIGLHFGWNFAEGAIFGTDVSGKSGTKGLMDSVLSGPTIASGGGFGPEASMYSVVFGVLITLAFMWLAHRRGYLVPRRRGARAAATATLSR